MEDSRRSATIIMYENIWFDAAILVGAMHVIAPVIVRNGFRFAARCKPLLVPVDELPKDVATCIAPRIPQIQNLGFELLGSTTAGC
jgi:hypothetical protein